MRFQGKLTSWNDTKGIGTITWNGSSDRVFVHISAFTDNRKRPVAGDIVIYEVEKDKNGKFKAVKVSFPKSQVHHNANLQKGGGLFIGAVTLIFFGYLIISIFSHSVPFIAFGIYAVTSLATFTAYCVDKNAAERKQWRIPEKTLHVMALLCGWPGAYAAQRMIRHKTIKEPFQSVFVATVFLNIASFVLYASPRTLNTVLSFISTIA